MDGAFRDAQMALASRTALALARSAALLSASDRVVQARLRARALAERALAEAEAAEATARAGGGRGDGGVEATRAALGAAIRGPEARREGFAPISVVAAQAMLGADEALLLVQPTATATYLFALTRDRLAWHRSDLTAAALAAAVTQLRRALDPAGVARSGEDAAPDVGARAGGFPRRMAFALYRKLWAPVAGTIGRAHTVYVVPGGALGALPLGLLPTRVPSGEDADPRAMRRTGWLIRRHALVTLPSVASLGALRSGQARSRNVAFIGFGAPLPNPHVASLPPLPGTARELAALATAMAAPASSVVTGSAATEAAVARADLAGAAVVAFATHGLMAGEAGAGAEPALVLSPGDDADDGLLRASEAARLTLDADWVILSACNTAAGDPGAGGEGLSGLARGFFAAGARAVLASHWRVRDNAVEALTVATIRLWRRQPAAGRAAALRQAMLAMIEDRARPERADPAYWAPLVVAGEGR